MAVVTVQSLDNPWGPLQSEEVRGMAFTHKEELQNAGLASSRCLVEIEGSWAGCVRKGDLGLKEPSPLIKLTGLRALCRERLRKKSFQNTLLWFPSLNYNSKK